MIPASDLTDAELVMARSRAQQAMAGLAAGTVLQLQPQTYELLVINPRELARGTVHVDYASGLVCWDRNIWTDLGYLPGYPREGAHAPYIGPGTIRAALLGPQQLTRRRSASCGWPGPGSPQRPPHCTASGESAHAE